MDSSFLTDSTLLKMGLATMLAGIVYLIYVKYLEKLKLTLPSDRVKTIHQGNLTAEEDKQLRKIASSHSEEEIKEKTGNTITKQEYLNLWK